MAKERSKAKRRTSVNGDSDCTWGRRNPLQCTDRTSHQRRAGHGCEQEASDVECLVGHVARHEQAPGYSAAIDMSGEARITFEVHCAREAVVCPQTWVVKVGGSTSCMGAEENRFDGRQGGRHLHNSSSGALLTSTAIHTIIEQVHRWYCLMWASRQHPIASPQLAQQAGNPSLFADRSIRTSGIVLGLKSPPPAQFRLWATCSPMHHPVICHHVVATPIGDVLVDASLSIFYTSPRQLTLAGILVRG
ncbi:hypothetical protein COCCADRAFT_28956 [Bipolaris zeicola 26-R-13]|uniref:Uncharacterized protein n=1 Tax=Cochliobolus carbonum (strain 26-R-13) TaxID=930089 RepID=W6Y4R7_COCC2|nr:uncharacterized protein COCCADRAFT_28956 [Bipolaris zeicola 26-R-13]EUC30079.1 hypothetical protein COCCADRAFT_28956 [Bipolaris zeicola 26-R-13]